MMADKNKEEADKLQEQQNDEKTKDNKTDAQREKLIIKYPDTFEKIEALYTDTWDKGFIIKPVEEFNKILEILVRYEQYSFFSKYNIESDIYNFDKFYFDYYFEISKDRDTLFSDLIYLFRIGYIDLFMPDEAAKFFIKTKASLGKLNDPYPFLENLCKLYNSIEYGSTEAKAIIYFTTDGDRYRKMKEALDLQKTTGMEKELQKEQDNLEDKINSYSKAIILIAAIIIAAPLLVVKVSAIKRLLVMDGCLIIAISIICSVLNIALFELKRKHRWLLVPIIVGIGLILLSIKFT